MRGAACPPSSKWFNSPGKTARSDLRSVAAVLAELETTAGRNAHFDARLKGIKRALAGNVLSEGTARAFAQDLGLGLQAPSSGL